MIPAHSIERRGELPWPRAMLLSVGFILLYVLLDRVSYIHDLQHTEITPWGPNIALLIAVTMYYGKVVLPLTVLAPALSEIVLRDAPPLGSAVIGAMVCIGCTYTAAGILLRHLLRDQRQPSVSWFTILLLVIAGSALVEALLYPAVLVLNGDLTEGSYLTAVRIDWIGDMNGIIILLPLVLILRGGGAATWREVRSHPRLLAVQTAVLAAAFLLGFRDAWSGPDAMFHTPFYLLFLPIIWIALRWGAGVTAIALATLQIGIVVLVAKHNTPESFLAIQVLMVLLAGTGLFMGISVAENERFGVLMRSKDDELSGLRARMAVSELNSAIGHELNNPLAALVNYLRSASLMLESGYDRDLLQRTIDKAHGEATRSISVVRKLREFFRSGEVQRQPVDPKKLAVEALSAMQNKLRQANIAVTVELPADLPIVDGDPLQLSMVLQNLLANAHDAVIGLDPRRVRVAVAMVRRENDVMISVEDTGPGIPEPLREQIFRPMSSRKPGGMGLGLAICRSLVEANEGRIWLVRSDVQGTCIAFSVPLWKTAVEEGKS